MNKVICDVCGTAYPETEPRCPICDCVKSDSGQTSAGNAAEDCGYTYVKGGRFSKSNVRKRLKANQKNPDYTPPSQMPVLMPENKPEDVDSDEQDELPEDEPQGVSNTGLIIIVVLLLLAIIAVASYLVIEFFGGREEKKWTQSPTSSTFVQEPDSSCTGLTAPQTPVVLNGVGDRVDLKTVFQKVPADTTDVCFYEVGDSNIASVDDNGIVVAVGSGETTVTVSCGNQQIQIAIKCDFEQDNPVEDPDNNPVEDPDDNPVEDPDDNPIENPDDEPDETVVLKLRYSDVTLDHVYPTLQLYRGDLDPAAITWSSSNEAVATVKDGVVTAASLGSVTITAEYKGQTATCKVHVSQKALDKLGIGNDDQPEEDSQQPESNAIALKKDDVTMQVGETWSSYSGTVDVSEVVWATTDESVATVSNGVVTAVGAGKATISAKYGDEEVTCIVRVN